MNKEQAFDDITFTSTPRSQSKHLGRLHNSGAMLLRAITTVPICKNEQNLYLFKHLGRVQVTAEIFKTEQNHYRQTLHSHNVDIKSFEKGVKRKRNATVPVGTPMLAQFRDRII